MKTGEPIGKFDCLAELGKGACSTILKVRRLADSKVYALKVVAMRDPDDIKYVEQSEHEFRIASKLDHPNLVKVYAFEEDKGLFRVKGSRLLLEYVDGLPLSECRDLPIKQLITIAADAAAALRHMHKRGVFHADVKPANIMVTAKGDVKLIDYGLAWRDGDNKDRVQGTLEFLAPEQAKRKVVNAKTDIFNFGATMYRIFTGKSIPPEFRQRGSSGIERIDTLVRPLRQANPLVPTELDVLIRRCVRVKPDDRPENMREVRDKLRAIGNSFTSKAD